MAHDLSYDKTTVDFELLFQSVLIAVSACKVECERQLHRLQEAMFKRDWCEVQYAVKELARQSAMLATASDTLHVLEESKTRSEFVLINKIKPVHDCDLDD